jgi:hypothetical protein
VRAYVFGRIREQKWNVHKKGERKLRVVRYRDFEKENFFLILYCFVPKLTFFFFVVLELLKLGMSA